MSRSPTSPGRTTRTRDVYGNSAPQQAAPGKQSAAARAYEANGHATTVFDRATAGAATEVPYRAAMEQTFGASFADVEAFTSCHALAEVNANAAAKGNKVAFATATPNQAVVAHELTHVLQQRQTGIAAEAAHRDLAQPGDAAEREADSIAARVAAYGAGIARVSVTATPTARVHLDRGTGNNQLGVDKPATFVSGDRITITGNTSLGPGTYHVLVNGDNGTELWGELYDRDTGAGTGRVVSAQCADLTRIVDRFGNVVPTRLKAPNAIAYAGSKVTGNTVGGVGDVLGTIANLSGRNPTAQWALGRTALIAGMGEGVYQCLHDALTAIPELIQMVYSATMSHARGTLLADATGLIAALTRLTPADIANLVIPGLGDLSSQLQSPTLKPWEKYHAFGKVLGYLLAEIAFAVVTAGAALGAKIPAILARFGKLSRIAAVRRAANTLSRSDGLRRLERRFAEELSEPSAVASAGKTPKPSVNASLKENYTTERRTTEPSASVKASTNLENTASTFPTTETELDRVVKTLKDSGVTGDLAAVIARAKGDGPDALAARGELRSFQRALDRGYKVKVIEAPSGKRAPQGRLSPEAALAKEGMELRLEVKTATEPPTLGTWRSHFDKANRQIKQSNSLGEIHFDWTAVNLETSDFSTKQHIEQLLGRKMTDQRGRAIVYAEIRWQDPTSGRVKITFRERGKNNKVKAITTKDL